MIGIAVIFFKRVKAVEYGYTNISRGVRVHLTACVHYSPGNRLRIVLDFRTDIHSVMKHRASRYLDVGAPAPTSKLTAHFTMRLPTGRRNTHTATVIHTYTAIRLDIIRQVGMEVTAYYFYSRINIFVYIASPFPSFVLTRHHFSTTRHHVYTTIRQVNHTYSYRIK